MATNVKDLLGKGVNAAHRTLFDLTNGKIGGRGLGMPVVKLTTTGRKTGKRRETMLTSPLRDGDDVILVASWGGDDRHPTWFLNLRENPDVHLKMEGRSFEATARVAEGPERERLWAELTAAHSNYAGYQRRTDREIPVVVCRPKPAE